MQAMTRGRYRARLAETAGDLRAAQALRWQAFRVRRGQGTPGGLDADRFDARCDHLLVEDVPSGDLLACCRLMRIEGAAGLADSYSARDYDLTALAAYAGPLAEIGRFCLAPGVSDPSVLRLAWAAIAEWVAGHDITLMFGCSSFSGTQPEPYRDAFALLAERHLAPRRWQPRVRAPEVFRFAAALRGVRPDLRRALAALPPLLRSYLLMGGWVSDHAVIDRDLGTLHVLTGVDIRAIPPARVRSLTGMALAATAP